MNKDEQSSVLSERIIREAECRLLTGLCRTTRYLMEKDGKFPSRRKLGGRSVGWLLTEVNGWVCNQPKSQIRQVA